MGDMKLPVMRVVTAPSKWSCSGCKKQIEVGEECVKWGKVHLHILCTKKAKAAKFIWEEGDLVKEKK